MVDAPPLVRLTDDVWVAVGAVQCVMLAMERPANEQLGHRFQLSQEKDAPKKEPEDRYTVTVLGYHDRGIVSWSDIGDLKKGRDFIQKLVDDYHAGCAARPPPPDRARPVADVLERLHGLYDEDPPFDGCEVVYNLTSMAEHTRKIWDAAVARALEVVAAPVQEELSP